MKILVTGVAGFIGSHLAERLLKEGHEVIGVDNFNPYYDRSLKELNIEHIKNKKFTLIEKDLSLPDMSDALPRDIEIVYHLAAQPGISDKVSFDDYISNNIVATYRLLEYARILKHLHLFVNVATSSIYGAYATGDEYSMPQPTSYYGVTKLAAEQLVLAYWRDKKFPACSLRPFSVYGERERPEKMYSKLIGSIVEDREFPLYEGSESHKRSYTYVGDIVDGMILVLSHRDAVLGEIFNLGTRDVRTTGDGIKIVEKLSQKNVRIKIAPKRPGEQQETMANIDKAERLLGYSPKTTLEEGLARQIKWYTEKIHGKL